MSEEQPSAKDAVNMLFDQYSSDIYRYARLMLSDDADAKDVVQEMFFRAFQSWGDFRQESNPKTWLLTIARNYIFKLLGKRKRDLEFLTNYEPPQVENKAEILEDLYIVEQALARLKQTYRQVIVLRHINNFSVQETSKILGWSESKVTTTDQRAMKKLREILEVSGEEVGVRHEVRTQHT